MPLPAPNFVMAHGVLGLRDAVSMDPARDQRFIEAAKGEFPNVINHQMPPTGIPAFAPYLVLASTSSQLALSLGQVDFEVRFYGDYIQDIDRGLEYVERKLSAVRASLVAAGLRTSMIGVIATLQFSCQEIDGATPAEHVQATLLQTSVGGDVLQDALARVTIRVRDAYFVSLTVANYETRVFQRPMIPGLPARVRPWEGQVTDQGIELAIDINNNLEGRIKREDTDVTDEGIRAVMQMLRELATTTGPAFAETGELALAAVTASSKP